MTERLDKFLLEKRSVNWRLVCEGISRGSEVYVACGDSWSNI